MAIYNPLPNRDLIDYLASRYGVSPHEVAEWDLFDSIAMYFAGVRNEVRWRIANISDMIAVGDMSAEVKTYDKNGREIKGEGRSDPVGFKEHMRRLYSILGMEDGGHTDSASAREVAAKQATEMLTGFFGGGVSHGG